MNNNSSVIVIPNPKKVKDELSLVKKHCEKRYSSLIFKITVPAFAIFFLLFHYFQLEPVGMVVFIIYPSMAFVLSVNASGKRIEDFKDSSLSDIFDIDSGLFGNKFLPKDNAQESLALLKRKGDLLLEYKDN